MVMTQRLFLLAGLAAAAMGRASAAAETYPWCANFHEGAGSNCGFTSYEQCMQTVRGSGGFCSENTPDIRPAAKPRRPKQPRPRPKHD